MTEVCLVATEAVGDELVTELMDYPTAKAALQAYELMEPYANAVMIETISLGAAVSLLNDLDWYLTRLTRDALVREPSIDAEEYLSRSLAERIRDGDLDPTERMDRLKLYGVQRGSGEEPAEGEPPDRRRWLVEPLYVTRTDGGIPEYDLRDVEDTLAVRIDEADDS